MNEVTGIQNITGTRKENSPGKIFCIYKCTAKNQYYGNIRVCNASENIELL